MPNIGSGRQPTYGQATEAEKKKLRELILYISSKCESDGTFGATKLNKILFWSDFTSYMKFRRPITGVPYMKLPKGPAPKHLVPVREEMLRNNEIVIRQRAVYTHSFDVITPLREPDLSGFRPEDIAIVDAFIQECWGMKADDISNMSHCRAWKIARERFLIPYEAGFLAEDAEYSQTEIARAQELIREHGWAV